MKFQPRYKEVVRLDKDTASKMGTLMRMQLAVANAAIEMLHEDSSLSRDAVEKALLEKFPTVAKHSIAIEAHYRYSKFKRGKRSFIDCNAVIYLTFQDASDGARDCLEISEDRMTLTIKSAESCAIELPAPLPRLEAGASSYLNISYRPFSDTYMVALFA